MCNATHSRREAVRSTAIARNCAECVRGRGAGADFDDDPLGAVRRLARGVSAGREASATPESEETP